MQRANAMSVKFRWAKQTPGQRPEFAKAQPPIVRQIDICKDQRGVLFKLMQISNEAYRSSSHAAFSRQLDGIPASSVDDP
jgi:hypothetical protein